LSSAVLQIDNFSFFVDEVDFVFVVVVAAALAVVTFF